jgi:CubicO group peptidase (beta-lactamase class C family)
LSIEAEPAPHFDRRRLERVAAVLEERYVRTGKLPGFRLMLASSCEILLDHCAGLADIERKRPVERDTIFRIHSMTKPLTSVLLMMLVEEGLVGLDDPVHRILPPFRRLKTTRAGTDGTIAVLPLAAPMRIVDLLRHTSGLTYAVQGDTPTATEHRTLRLGFRDGPTGSDLIEALAQIPLDFSPGEAWNYSISTDVIGCIIEQVTGQDLATVMRERILLPLGMGDTGFFVPDAKLGRFAACYGPNRDGVLEVRDDPFQSAYRIPPRHVSGGGGLVSTAPDYVRFCQLLLKQGHHDGRNLLSPNTIRRMCTNHLPGGDDLRNLSRSLFSETTYAGVGFGLGFAVTMKPERTLIAGSAGDCFWGGMASTSFWIDPLEGFACVFCTQLIPSDTYPLRRDTRELVYAALLRHRG